MVRKVGLGLRRSKKWYTIWTYSGNEVRLGCGPASSLTRVTYSLIYRNKRKSILWEK